MNPLSAKSVQASNLFSEELNDINSIALRDKKRATNMYKNLLFKKGIVEECKKCIENTFYKANNLINEISTNGNNLFKFSNMIKQRKC